MKNITAVYVRVSTLDQNKGIQSQIKALKDYCENHNLPNVKMYQDKISGKDLNRPAFKSLSKDIFDGKVRTIVVWKLDRISRSLRDGINTLIDWLNNDIRVISITQQFDFNGNVGKLIASVLFSVAEMERENLRENTKRGLAAAKAKGIRLGRPNALINVDIINDLKGKGLNITQISKQLKVSRQTIYNSMKG